jgi:hypothetical protein
MGCVQFGALMFPPPDRDEHILRYTKMKAATGKAIDMTVESSGGRNIGAKIPHIGNVITAARRPSPMPVPHIRDVFLSLSTAISGSSFFSR